MSGGIIEEVIFSAVDFGVGNMIAVGRKRRYRHEHGGIYCFSIPAKYTYDFLKLMKLVGAEFTFLWIDVDCILDSFPVLWLLVGIR